MMKRPFFPLLVLLGLMTSSGHAFTLDAAGYEGGDLARDPMSLRVPGYGEVVFESGIGAPLVVTSGYQSVAALGASALIFNEQDAVKISVNAGSGDPLVGFDAGFQLIVDAPQIDSGNRSSAWKSIPEPASAWIGLTGMLILLVGRRR